MAGQSAGPNVRYSRARTVVSTRPRRITWLRSSSSGLRSTGFISTRDATPAASACMAWAQPISSPAAVTCALFDMFWDLNGSARSPWRKRSRQSPAASTLLPAWEPVPCSMIAGVRPISGIARGRRARASRLPWPARRRRRPRAGRVRSPPAMAAMVRPALGLAVFPPSRSRRRHALVPEPPASAAPATRPAAARRVGTQLSASSSRAAALPRYSSSPSR